MTNSNIYLKQAGGAISKKNITNLFNLIVTKKEFFIQIFANLIAQLGITYYIMERNTITFNLVQLIGLFFVQIFLIITIIATPITSVKLILFCVFSSINGLLLSGLKKKYDASIIQSAIVGAVSVFAVMFAFGVFLIISGIKLGIQVGLALLSALTLLIIVRIVFIFIPSSSNIKRYFAIFGLILFSAYVIYDTNSILQRNYYGDFITASLDYYLDFINIFRDLVTLNGFGDN
jgi:FtsH-binding integral membrane protein